MSGIVDTFENSSVKNKKPGSMKAAGPVCKLTGFKIQHGYSQAGWQPVKNRQG
jgi:hypothetical protein